MSSTDADLSVCVCAKPRTAHACTCLVAAAAVLADSLVYNVPGAVCLYMEVCIYRCYIYRPPWPIPKSLIVGLLYAVHCPHQFVVHRPTA